MASNSKATAVATSKHQQQQHPSKSYQRLLVAIDKGLVESRRLIDTTACIKETYGDDVSIFGNDGNDNLLLVDVFDSMIEKVQDSVKEGTIQALEQENVPQRLQHVDAIILRLERQYRSKLANDQRDRQNTRQLLERQTNALLTNNNNNNNHHHSNLKELPSHAVQYHAFSAMQREKEAVLQEVEEMTKQAEEWQHRYVDMERQIQESVQGMEGGLGKEVQQACDTISSELQREA